MKAPRTRGSYVLVIKLGEKLNVTQGVRRVTLDPGLYVYVGSAGGPGGIGARVRRHLLLSKGEKEGPQRWHIDQVLTSKWAKILDVCWAKGCWGAGAEHDIVECLIKTGRFQPISKGFGSSDDPQSPSHLLKLLEKNPDTAAREDAANCLRMACTIDDLRVVVGCSSASRNGRGEA